MAKSNNNNPLWTVLKIYIALDAFWAAVVATLASVVASQGLSLSGTGAVAATTGGIGAWILSFIGAAIQGGIFLVVFSVFGALLVLGAAYLTKDNGQLRRFVTKYALVCLVLDLIWAFVVGTASSFLTFIGIKAGAAAGATTLGSVLLWIVGFVAGFCQGAIFLTVFTLFIVFGLFVYALFKR